MIVVALTMKLLDNTSHIFPFLCAHHESETPEFDCHAEKRCGTSVAFVMTNCLLQFLCRCSSEVINQNKFIQMHIPLMKPLAKGRRLRFLIADNVLVVKFPVFSIERSWEISKGFLTFVIVALYQTHLEFRYTNNDLLEREKQK